MSEPRIVPAHRAIRMGTDSVAELPVGSASMFAAAGMTEVSRPTPGRAVMRVEW